MDIETKLMMLKEHCDRGWAVFPCNGKRPATKQGVYSGNDNYARWRQQWAYRQDWNIGVHAGGSDLIIIDCDLPDFRKLTRVGPFDDDGVDIDLNPTPGISAWLEICAHHDHDPEDTYAVSTPSGGVHFYYAYEGDEYIPPSVGLLAPLVDVRSSGSYVVAAGSYVDGCDTPYERCGGDEPLPAPEWLLEYLRPKPIDIEERTRVVKRDAQLYKDDSLKWLAFMVQDIENAVEGTRNVTFANKLWRAEMNNARDEDFDALCQAALNAGLDQREIDKAVRTLGRG